MALKWILHLGIYLSTLIISTADLNLAPKAENVQWMSLDFKTVLIWSPSPSKYSYTVSYFYDERYYEDTPDCIRLSESECDLTHCLQPLDRTYYARIQTEPETMDNEDNLEELPHTISPSFNPYRESNISAVTFTVKNVNETTVLVNITDPLTSIYEQGEQLTIRDILKKDLQYKISYYKTGSTGKKDIISNTSEAVVPDLDPGQSYCFMVAAYIPSRPKASRHGALSGQSCIRRKTELSPEAWIAIVLTAITIIIIVVIVLYCKCCRGTNQNLQMTQSSAPL
ncbi:tissue factor-like [Takifugu rubripes]|uniref:Tissue factor n=1 Tax=Takifugu rubripes TaxID=31033 RepID=H2T1B7_TAKRU|nr:tissue factor-like [Takifugu rubripes]|eukprot:XP_003975537.1 PREDICTED: tissue factor-like [Takifugu rubripes]